MRILHLHRCSEKFAQAEIAIKARLGFDPECPRCRLNNASEDVLDTCKELLSQLTMLLRDIGMAQSDIDVRPDVVRAIAAIRKTEHA